jgi:hypothetical protein
VTKRRRDNLLIVHWHDLGRYLGVYGHAGVPSPRLDQFAAWWMDRYGADAETAGLAT